MAASHTKLKPSNFSISIQKPSWLPVPRSGTACARRVEETPIERRPKISMHAEVGKASVFRSSMPAQMELMGEKCTVTDFIKQNSYHLKGCRHTGTKRGGGGGGGGRRQPSARPCLQINNSPHFGHTIFMLLIPFHITQSLTRKKRVGGGGCFFLSFSFCFALSFSTARQRETEIYHLNHHYAKKRGSTR